ncbi:MAG: sigma-70 family RNA polymerase sigma factor [Solirubrobacteraceae bacterium]
MNVPVAPREAHLRALYDEYAGPLLGYVQGLLGEDRALAEDVVQETLLRAWRQGDRLERRHARQWLFTVARNLAVDRYRARRARPQETGEAPLRSLEAPDELERALLAWQLADALRALKPAHRQVVVELYYRDRSVAEAAAVIGVPEGTVKSRTYFALRALRRALEERGVTRP